MALLSGGVPGIDFLDEGSQVPSSLIKPHQRSELHLLDGHLTECSDRTLPANPSLIRTLEFGSLGRALMVFTDDHQGNPTTVALSSSAITIHGGELMVDGVVQGSMGC